MNTSRILEKGIEPKVFWDRLCGEISSYRSCEDVYFFHKDNQGQVLLLGKSESAQVIDLPEVVRKKISGNQSNSEMFDAELEGSFWYLIALDSITELKGYGVLRMSEVMDDDSLNLIRSSVLACVTAFRFSRDSDLKSESLNQTSKVLDLGLIVGESKSFEEASMRICNELVSQFNAMRVSLGWNEKGTFKVKATNHGGNVRSDTEKVSYLARVMDESMTQQSEIVFPDPKSATINKQHKSYSQSTGNCTVVSVPLRLAEEVIGVVTVEYDNEDTHFDNAHIGLLRVFMDLIAPRLDSLHSVSGWIGKRAWRKARKRLAGMLGYRHTGLKFFVCALLFSLIASCVIPINHKVKSPFVLRTEASAVLTAPISGYIEKVHFKVGDVIKEGDLLVSLDQKEILMKRAQSIAERESQSNDVRRYEAEGKLTDMRLAQLSVKKADAQIELFDYQLDKALISAPFDGVIVEGDLQDRLSSPVKPGEPLLRVIQLVDTFGELQVDERDVHFIKKGMKGELAYTSHPEKTYEVLIDNYEPVAVVQELGTHFRVRAMIESDPEDWWRPGMSGVCKIHIGKRSAAWVYLHRTIEFIRMKLWL